MSGTPPLTPSEEAMADIIHEARCGPVLWRGNEHVPWSDDHREWDIATAKAMLLLGVSLDAARSEPAGLDAERLDDARFDGYREGRAAVWAELQLYATENRAHAEYVLGRPIVIADEVRGILSPKVSEP